MRDTHTSSKNMGVHLILCPPPFKTWGGRVPLSPHEAHVLITCDLFFLMILTILSISKDAFWYQACCNKRLKGKLWKCLWSKFTTSSIKSVQNFIERPEVNPQPGICYRGTQLFQRVLIECSASCTFRLSIKIFGIGVLHTIEHSFEC